MAGRTKQDVFKLKALLAQEFKWQMIFCGMREGLQGWDTSLADPETAGLKWRPRACDPADRFLRNHYATIWAKHAKDYDQEFTEKIVEAEPHDLPPEPHVWELLKRAHTAKELRQIVPQSQVLRFFFGENPADIPLYRHAKEFCRAKRYSRYPSGGKQNRASSKSKRVDYLARVMAGLSLWGKGAATAEDLLRKMKHGPDGPLWDAQNNRCLCWRCKVNRIDAKSVQGQSRLVAQIPAQNRKKHLKYAIRNRAGQEKKQPKNGR